MDLGSLKYLELVFKSVMENESQLADDDFFKNFLEATIAADNPINSAEASLITNELSQDNTQFCTQLRKASKNVTCGSPSKREQEITGTITNIQRKLSLVQNMRFLNDQLRTATANLNNVIALNGDLKQKMNDTNSRYRNLEQELYHKQLCAAPLYTNIPSKVYSHEEFGVQCAIPYSLNKGTQVVTHTHVENKSLKHCHRHHHHHYKT
ncbi:hypothetical protein PPYR_06378 [Photinus pyralis]|uniref:Uncharacterized protein n=1 Tax=Photinus pyralis TaxID=7054 RepID=A0A5N4AJC5_PHOPY|nr:hypothetical protein PPYR_08403 [Photinus pyralis]KAB0800638.1 hypothetical protein PPYR_06378 [Photinus pyralis]